ncbi:helix-turn-helix domain-containing protein [Streptomyces sp. NPDC059788]|uniref:helix-turn-helix domain-containing protein n=1 Tax=Streptomyces sp. NPDC059788 TaxID=3346948 RepID=UPI0036588370
MPTDQSTGHAQPRGHEVKITRQVIGSGDYRLWVRVLPAPGFGDRARRLGGQRTKVSPRYEYWRFSPRVETAVRDLCLDIWGTDGTWVTDPDRVNVHWDIWDVRDQQHLWLAGRFIAGRDERDEPVKLGWGVRILSGGFQARGGSRPNPRVAPREYEDTVLEISDVPRGAAEKAVAALGGFATLVEQEHAHGWSWKELWERREQLLADLSALNTVLNGTAPPGPERCRCGEHECIPDGYSVEEVAQFAGVTRHAVCAWCRSGAIPAVKVGGGRWIILKPLPEKVNRTRIARPELD